MTRIHPAATCPVCQRSDVRIRPSGKLYNHGIPPGCPDSARLTPRYAGGGFKLCAGSGQWVPSSSAIAIRATIKRLRKEAGL